MIRRARSRYFQCSAIRSISISRWGIRRLWIVSGDSPTATFCLGEPRPKTRKPSSQSLVHHFSCVNCVSSQAARRSIGASSLGRVGK